MKATEIFPEIYHIGVNIHDKNYLFEGLWSIPHGISINAYFVKGEKIAIIDSWCTTNEYCPVGVNDLEKHPGAYERILESVHANPKMVQYVVINHIEPDHSSWLGNFYKDHPEIQIICTKMAAIMLKSFYGITENIRTVKTGDTLDLGAGKELVFYEAPNVHWPETMVTFEKSSGVLFTCDAFGSYGTVDQDAISDLSLSKEKILFYEKEALRYYSNIVALYSRNVLNLAKIVETLPIKIIAPSHGIVWIKDPQRIIKLYGQFANYSINGGEKKICLIWSSMYGNTEKALKQIKNITKEYNIDFIEHRVPQADKSFILRDIWQSKGLIFAMPTYDYKMFPPMAHLILDLKFKKVAKKKVFRLGSYGWAGGAEKDFRTITEGVDWEILPSVEWAGRPDDKVFHQIEENVRLLISLL